MMDETGISSTNLRVTGTPSMQTWRCGKFCSQQFSFRLLLRTFHRQFSSSRNFFSLIISRRQLFSASRAPFSCGSTFPRPWSSRARKSCSRDTHWPPWTSKTAGHSSRLVSSWRRIHRSPGVALFIPQTSKQVPLSALSSRSPRGLLSVGRFQKIYVDGRWKKREACVPLYLDHPKDESPDSLLLMSALPPQGYQHTPSCRNTLFPPSHLESIARPERTYLSHLSIPISSRLWKFKYYSTKFFLILDPNGIEAFRTQQLEVPSVKHVRSSTPTPVIRISLS